ncbi:MAG: carbohydrate-binding protein [Chitinophagales bacterium]
MQDKRVEAYPFPAQKNQNVEVKYNGLLKCAGADVVFLHYGQDGWKNCATKPMFRQNDGSFYATVTATGDHEVNLCFKDSADHWDNNNGWNWNVPIKLTW